MSEERKRECNWGINEKECACERGMGSKRACKWRKKR